MLWVHTAGSWLNLGKLSAEPRQVLRGISASSRRNLGKFSADLKTSKGRRKDSPKEAKRLPGCPKGAERGAKRRPKAPQDHKTTSLYFRTVFEAPLIFPKCWPVLGAKLVNCSRYVLTSFLDVSLEASGSFLVSFWWLFGCICWYCSRLCEK